MIKQLCKQEIGFYDLKDNAVGALTTRLGSDASQLRLVVSARLGDKLSSCATGTCRARPLAIAAAI